MKRVFQVAKELNIHHDDIIMVLKDEGITVTSHMSTIDEKAYNFILKKFLKQLFYLKIRIRLESMLLKMLYLMMSNKKVFI